MATVKQKKIAKLIIENEALDIPLNAGQMLEKVGYSHNLVKQPGRVIESEGVKEALNEYGFSEDNAKRVVAEILLKKEAADKDRLKAAEQVFKVHGSYAPEKSITAHVELKEHTPETELLANEYEERLRTKMIHGNTTGTSEHTRVVADQPNKEREGGTN